MMKKLLSRAVEFCFPQMIGLLPGSSLSQVEFDGAVPNIGALLSLIQQIAAGAAPSCGQANVVTITTTTTGAIVFNAATLGGVPFAGANIVTTGGSTPATVTTDTAVNILSIMLENGMVPYVGMTFPVTITNNNSGTDTLTGGTGVTLVGTTTILTVSTRWFQGQVKTYTPPVTTQTLQQITLPQSTIVIANGANIAAPSSTLTINIGGQTVTYSSVAYVNGSGWQLQGCTGGTGTFVAGTAVTQALAGTLSLTGMYTIAGYSAP